MKKIILLLSILFITTNAFSQEYEYKFRLLLKDKGKTSYSINKPEEFLSAKSIERRAKYGIAIDESDLPISTDYLKKIEAVGGVIVAKSKWLNSVAVHCTDTAIVEKYRKLPFVKDVVLAWRGKPYVESAAKNDSIKSYPAKETISFGNNYGKGLQNIKMNNGQALHKAGFKGKGMDIAVIDGGFNNFHKIEMLNNLDIKGSKDFIYQHPDMFANGAQHGLSVLSCIGANKPMQFVGTAPEASFWLFNSEDGRSEYPIEEDYWVAAIEYADSVGVYVVNTSLGYSNFDAPAQSYTHADIDGKTAHISRAADRASDKGMLLSISAGNSGDSEWRKITPPSDAINIVTVGAVQKDSTVARFSSRGMTADLRVKPDVMALGVWSTVVNDKGLVSVSSGTSFSSPIMCGMLACLWQAFPELSNKEIISVVRESSNKYESFDEDYGYGIPDMGKAMEIAQAKVDAKKKAMEAAQPSDKKAKSKKK
ncbi:S8 family serine peptidase [Dysgonomonas sp. 511]|uniref:S8 family serine peptidase n=1 Tax=Dysgonomonas sp. 511 TaxID=2302930 RepID=UPI0013D13ADE|nr:S8 family serine peptidase [Dysgonomonas sp. 511]NDV77544.1 serine protease [Dysgonomonas sp. 511]